MYPGSAQAGGNQLREFQVQQFLRSCPSAAPINAQRDTFDIHLRANGSTQLITIRVTLPPPFPRLPPEITVPTSGAQHPWLDPQGRVVGSTSLFGWNANSSLAVTVTEVVNQFIANPPRVVGGMHQGPPPYPQGRVGPGGPLSQSQSRSQSADEEHLALPPIPNEFESLNGLGLAELEKLRDDDAAFERFFKEMELVKSPTQIRDDMRNSNVDQAKKNLEYSEAVGRLQEEVKTWQGKAAEARREFDQVAKRQEKTLERYDPSKILRILGEKAEELDAASETVAENFKNGDTPVQGFIKQYLEIRQLYHLRSAKATQLQQQLRRA